MLSVPAIVAALLVGLAIGVLSGMLGIGGGTVMIPVFKLGFGMTPIVCTATSLFAVILTAISGSITHIRRKTCVPRLGIALGLGGAITSPLGVWLASISPDWAIMTAATIIIAYSALTMFQKALKMKPASAPASTTSVSASASDPALTTPASAPASALSSIASTAGLQNNVSRETLSIDSVAQEAHPTESVASGLKELPVQERKVVASLHNNVSRETFSRSGAASDLAGEVTEGSSAGGNDGRNTEGIPSDERDGAVLEGASANGSDGVEAEGSSADGNVGRNAESASIVAGDAAEAVRRFGGRGLLVGAGIGMLAGVASGYVGIGGGFLMVPMLLQLLHLPMRLTSGTSLLAVMILAIPGVAMQASLGNVNWVAGILVALGTMPGAFFGARLISRMPERTLRFIFSGFLLVAAVMLMIDQLNIL